MTLCQPVRTLALNLASTARQVASHHTAVLYKASACKIGSTEEFPLSATRIQPNYAWFMEMKVWSMQFQINWFFLHLWMSDVASFSGVYTGRSINKAKSFHLNLEPSFPSIVKFQFHVWHRWNTNIYYFSMHFLNWLLHLLSPLFSFLFAFLQYCQFFKL